MTTKYLTLAAAAATFAWAAHSASASEELAQGSGCLACHTVDVKVVGPSFTDIAEKYRGQDGAADELAMKVTNGGSGNWGQIPMPPNAHLSAEDVQALVDWIMAM